MKKLNLYSVEDIDELAWPVDSEEYTLESPALAFFTDFASVDPLVVESNLSAVEVKTLMQKTHARLKFVVNERDKFLGIVGAEDLIDRKFVQKVSKAVRRDEIEVTELMIPKKKLNALDFNEIKTVSVANVVAVLKESGENYCLVVDRDKHKIRGIFSASEIARKLHTRIDIHKRPPLFGMVSADSEL
ncbi:MAG: CBS domain containing-hemolysin-like protein [Cellvibrionaceae bacterium]|jgi:CBS domain containing-hemolysin-like protein